jgi:hypothetical protein
MSDPATEHGRRERDSIWQIEIGWTSRSGSPRAFCAAVGMHGADAGGGPGGQTQLFDLWSSARPMIDLFSGPELDLQASRRRPRNGPGRGPMTS